MKKLLVIIGIIILTFLILVWRKDEQWKKCNSARALLVEKYKDSRSFYASQYMNAIPEDCKHWLLKIPF
ncbi:MAG: hypothetical protein COY68_01465 [Candidatus Levybacteria bacterium CG_4_10_14_0_8_um_filter_35_23]|nr:MAG: hypothetical protein COY68_01465 [Candidatus Levybacteria bacterium CG_4_10_14_0_8_um_filter_35_23]